MMRRVLLLYIQLLVHLRRAWYRLAPGAVFLRSVLEDTGSPIPHIRVNAFKTIDQLQSKVRRTVERIPPDRMRPLLRCRSTLARLSAAKMWARRETRDSESLGLVLELLQDDDLRVRDVAIDHLRGLPPEVLLTHTVAHLVDGDEAQGSDLSQAQQRFLTSLRTLNDPGLVRAMADTLDRGAAARPALIGAVRRLCSELTSGPITVGISGPASFHPGYHAPLLTHPIPGILLRNSVLRNERPYDYGRAYHFDPEHPFCILHETPYDVILSAWPVLNEHPWVLTLDFFEFPFLMDEQEFRLVLRGKAALIQERLTAEKQRRLAGYIEVLRSPHCRRILPWSEWCRETISRFVPDPEVTRKVEVLYPAIPLPPVTQRRADGSGKVRLLNCTRMFSKGGADTLRAFSILARDFDVSLKIIAPLATIPKAVRRAYRDNPNVEFPGELPHESVLEEYEKADIFVYPSLLDSFGMALLEAMSYGLPIVASNGARVRHNEIVEDGENGFLVEVLGGDAPPDYDGSLDFDSFVLKLRRLVSDRSLRERMGSSGRRRVAEGKFSKAARDRTLGRILREAAGRGECPAV